MSEIVQTLIGSNPNTITWWQMSVRAIVIFLYGIALLRLADRRAASAMTPFDAVVVIIIGSVLSRALTANASFWPSLAATATIVVLHRVLARIAYRWPPFGRMVKGNERRIVDDGKLSGGVLDEAALTHDDLLEALRLKGVSNLSKVKVATLERNGEISVVKDDE